MLNPYAPEDVDDIEAARDDFPDGGVGALVVMNTKRCGHCRPFAAPGGGLEALINAAPKDAVRVVDSDSDEYTSILTRHGIRAVPSIRIARVGDETPFVWKGAHGPIAMTRLGTMLR